MLAGGEPENEDLAMSYEKVARCLTWEYEQDLNQAEEFFLKSLEIRQRILKNIENGGRSEFLESPYSQYGAADADQLPMAYARIGESYMEIARMYQFAGEYEKALEYSIKYGEMIDTYTPENFSGKAYTLNDQGVSLYHLGINARDKGKNEDAMNYFINAEKCLREALEINRKMRGSLAVDTLDNEEYLADTLAAMGQYSAASNEYMAVLTMAEALLGSTHPRLDEIRQKMDFEHL